MLPNLIHLDMFWALTNVPDDMNTVENSDIFLTYFVYMLVGSNQIAPTELWRTNRIGLEHAPWSRRRRRGYVVVLARASSSLGFKLVSMAWHRHRKTFGSFSERVWNTTNHQSRHDHTRLSRRSRRSARDAFKQSASCTPNSLSQISGNAKSRKLNMFC